MITRRLEQDDVSTFRALRLASLKDAPDSFGSTYEDWQFRSDAELCAFLEDEPIFAAFIGDHPVGLTGLIPEKKSKQAHRWGLAMVYVSPEARGSGAANVLMSAAVAFAKDVGVLQLELSVNAANVRAIRFCERNSFQATGQIPRGYRTDGGFADEVMMVRFLDA
jgi:RimJ/RimL family protein N-acetyltransferase